ncbi:unnamed protein product [Ambrosiozyma monospora]|uniref:Unnamed protein product n=1 Tax=Ambrosiozyma monospora TaxID=43982 RepID=A0ACB5TJF4_AMBMO|nr:unnamed protein product [Ambrosiozyma monospora]
MSTLQLIHRFIEHEYKADSLNLAIQDGVGAGQSVPHLHCHIIPRYLKDGFGDGIYALLEKNEMNLGPDFFKKVGKPMVVLQDDEREPRTMEVMEKEAKLLSDHLEKYVKEIDAKQESKA